MVGTAGNDVFNGASGTVATTDIILDNSSTDSDTANLTVTGDFGATGAGNSTRVTGVENVNVNVNATAAKDVYANSFAGVQTLTVTRGDIVVGGSTIKGDKAVSVLELDATKVATVVAGAGTKAFSLTYAAATGNTDVFTGATVDASKAVGNVTITGPVTVTAGTTGTNGTVSVQGTGTPAQDKGAVSVTAATAEIVNVGNTTATTGTVTINAPAAHTVAASVAGGGSITALGGASTKGITVTAIDDSGVTVTTSYAGTKTSTSDKSGAISLTGGAGSVDSAAVSANGVVTLDQTNVDILNLSGNTAAVDYILNSAVGTKITASGAQNVTIRDSAANLDGVTITKSLTDGATLTVNIDGAVAAAESLAKAGADLFVFSADANSTSVNTLTFASGANLSLAKDQTALGLAGATAKSTINVATADDTAASGATIDITVGALTADTNITTLNIDATVGKFTATSTNAASTSAAIVVTGSKNVTFGAISNGKSLNAAASSGVISMSTASTTLKTITTGAGDDSITVSGAAAYTINAGEGDNSVTVSNGVLDGTNVATGSGADTVTITDASAIVVVTGDGNDTVNINVDGSNAIVALGGGTDTVVFGGAYDLKDSADFALLDVEVVDVTAGDVKISAASFANDTKFKLIGDATTDELIIINTGTAGTTIDASGVTFAATQNASLKLQGLAQKQDTITGSAKNDTIVATSGGDIVDGGSGVDLYDATNLAAATIEGTGTGTSQGVVINLGTTAVTNTSVLAATGAYTATSVTSVAAGSVAYTFAASASTNSAVTSSVSGIESVIGTSGRDYIVASPAGAGSITGGTGADYMVAGAGVDTFVIATADTGITVATADVISGFTTASDKLSLGAAGTALNYAEIAGVNGDTLTDVLVDVDAAMAAGATYVFVYGLDVNVATGGADAADGALFIDQNGDGTADDMIVLVGAATAAFLTHTDIIA